jgi:hypothetical protein
VETQLCIQLELAAKPLVFEHLAARENPFGTDNPWQLTDFRQRSIGDSRSRNPNPDQRSIVKRRNPLRDVDEADCQQTPRPGTLVLRERS